MEYMKMKLKYLFNQHGCIVIMKLAHIVGLISLPNFYKEEWKNKVHAHYSWAVNAFVLVNVTSLIVAYLKYSMRDSAESCGRLLEIISVLFLTAQAFHFKMNLKNVLFITDIFEATWSSHGNTKIILAHNRREKFLVGIFMAGGAIVLGVWSLYPLLPETESQLRNREGIHKMKYPQHTLPSQLYIPYIDQSELKYFIPLSILQTYLGIIILTEGLLSVLNFVVLPHNMKTLWGVLNKYTRTIGTVHTNARGARIFYTNISRGDYIDAELLETSKTQCKRATKHKFLCEQYEFYYLKQIILYEQELRNVKEKVEAHLKYNYSGVVILLVSGLSICLYGLLIPGLLARSARQKLIFEAIQFMCSGVSVFYGGETLASCNVSFKSALLDSFWYKCPRKIRKVIPLLILMNQTHKYLSVKGLIPCNYDFMVRIFKTGYSVFNLLRIQRLKIN